MCSTSKAIALLILAGLAAYCNSFTKAFVLDDTHWINNNSSLSDAPAYLRLMIGRPLIGLSILLNHRLGGFNVVGYHAVNLAIHLLAGLTVFGIVRRTLLLKRWQGRFARSASWLALTIALWWLVHPLTTQAVTYIIQRCESMMGLFYLLALYCVLRGYEARTPAGGRWWYAGAVAAGVCSAGAKEVSATIPLVVLLFDWMFLAGSFRQLVRQRWGLYLGFGLVWATNAACLTLGPKSDDMNAGFGLSSITPWQYLLTQSEVILYYLRLCFYPWPQCVIYRGWPLAQSLRDVLLPGSVVVALLLLTAWAVARRWWPGFLGAWFLLILAPTSSIMPIADVAFEHRMYLPLIGVIALVVLTVHALGARLLDRASVPQAGRAALAAAGVSLVALTLGTLTFCRNEDYQSDLALWRDTVKHYPSSFARQSLGSALLAEGAVDEALPYLEQAYEEEPNGLVLFFLGEASRQKGDLDRAVHWFSLALESMPGHAPSENNLGLTLYQQGKLEEAKAHLQMAIQQAPREALFHANLALVHDALGTADAAEAEYRIALRLDPASPERNNRRARELVLGDSRAVAVSRREALMLATKACRATGARDPELLDTLAMAYAANGRFDEAIATAQKGIARAQEAGSTEWLSVLQERVQLYRAVAAISEASAVASLSELGYAGNPLAVAAISEASAVAFQWFRRAAAARLLNGQVPHQLR
jgi:tetratricopeptide (TPR) repeat protein